MFAINFKVFDFISLSIFYFLLQNLLKWYFKQQLLCFPQSTLNLMLLTTPQMHLNCLKRHSLGHIDLLFRQNELYDFSLVYFKRAIICNNSPCGSQLYIMTVVLYGQTLSRDRQHYLAIIDSERLEIENVGLQKRTNLYLEHLAYYVRFRLCQCHCDFVYMIVLFVTQTIHVSNRVGIEQRVSIHHLAITQVLET